MSPTTVTICPEAAPADWRRVTLGYRALLHGCEIAEDCFNGMGPAIRDGATLEGGE